MGAPTGPPRESDVCRIWGRGERDDPIHQCSEGPASFSAKAGGCAGQPAARGVGVCELPGLECVSHTHQMWGKHLGKPHEVVSSLIQGGYPGGAQSPMSHQDGGSSVGSPWSREQQVRVEEDTGGRRRLSISNQVLILIMTGGIG